MEDLEPDLDSSTDEEEMSPLESSDEEENEDESKSNKAESKSKKDSWSSTPQKIYPPPFILMPVLTAWTLSYCKAMLIPIGVLSIIHYNRIDGSNSGSNECLWYQ